MVAIERWKFRKELEAKGKPRTPLTSLGVDVGYTRDKSVLAPRRGAHVDELVEFTRLNPLQVAQMAAKVLDTENRRATVRVDSIGIGAGTFSDLERLGYNAEAFDARSSAAGKTDRTGQMSFHNMRAWAWWNMRDLLDPVAGEQIELPPDDMLIEQLCTPRWKKPAEKYMVEPKEDIIARLGFSPDRADAVVMAFVPDLPPLPAPVPGRAYRGPSG